MTPERWTHLTELFEAAIDRAPGERAAFLAASCSEESLRRAVERLIASHEDAERTDFGSAPAFQVTADIPLAPGARLGRYEVLALVGTGGVGNVYRARDPQLARDVGIKVLRRHHDLTPDDLQRFEREARAAGALQHPNILAVYDVGIADGAPYVVSELLAGETLRDRLERGPLPAHEAAAVARQIISGIAAAHDRGIIHRDLKPANLFLTRDGTVKILDFGLAKRLFDDVDADADLMERGLVMGTAGYMAPEQIRGENADVRSDLFAFGAVLYELLTGERAFQGDLPADTMQAVLTTEPAALHSLPVDVGSIVRRCLAKDPAGRFASAREVQDALAAKPRTPRLPYAAAAALIIVAAITAVMIDRRQAPPGPGSTGRPALAVLPFVDRSGDSADAWLPTGVASMFVTSLAQTPGLDVIGTERLETSFKELGRAPSDRSAALEAARRAGAGAVLFGTLFRTGSDVGLDVQVQDVATGRVVVARSARGPDLFGLVDTVAGDVRSALDIANRPPGRPLRDVTTTSLDAYALYTKGQLARHNNRYTDARTLFEEALRIDPAFTLARAQLVTLLDRLGEAGAAANERRIVAGQLHRLPDRERLLAGAVEEYGEDPSKAIALLEQLLARYPDDEEAYDAIIHAYTHNHEPAYWKKSLPIMQRWARAIPGPGSGHFHNHYGYAYIEHGLFTEAEREFRAYIRVSPDEANAYDSLAELYVMTGRPSLAIGTYDQALRLNPQFGWSHFGRAYAYAMERRYDDAFADLATLHDLGPRGGIPATAVEMLHALLSARVGRYADAARHLDEGRRLARQLEDPSAESGADLFDAMLALERGDHARAITAADRAAHITMDASVEIMRIRRSALAMMIAGIAEARRGRAVAARARLEALRQLDTSGDDIQASWRQGLAGEIALREERFDEAEQAFRAAEYPIGSSFAIYPALVVLSNNPPFRDGLARTALARGDRSRARDLYERLNRPDAASTWEAVFEPRYARTAAQLATRLRSQPSVQRALAAP